MTARTVTLVAVTLLVAAFLTLAVTLAGGMAAVACAEAKPACESRP